MSLTRYERNKRWRKNKPEVWRAVKQRYYKRSELTATNARQSWTIGDCTLVMLHNRTDSQLAILIGRSVRAIQMQRIRLKRKIKCLR